ncbi:CHAT domain-containing protein [Myxococcus sp. RHSTA-1-4]|uniref:CHAT domain-containing protein n=1 Tax=Myxococcus sp. RHSTA-1-4 TaxID=2874601 RepID=UPI001CBFD5AB|nr:CHAT domain-containing protein [Myxococcus sp. RHSTA-1-4]MBZ4421694.1 CHAT domain-containing protein [Myxococcus sp. RHSTA-1-4]
MGTTASLELAMHASEEGRYQEAVSLFEQAAEELRQTEDVFGMCYAAMEGAAALQELGRSDEARERLLQLRPELERIAPLDSRCIGYLRCAELLDDVPDLKLELSRCAAEAARDTGRRDLRCLACDRYGTALVDDDRLAEAGPWLEAAAEEARELPPETSTRYTAFLDYGNWLHERGESAAAIPWLRSVAENKERLTSPSRQVDAMLTFSEALRADGDTAQARHWARAAAERAGQEQAPQLRSVLRTRCAMALREAGDREGAVRQFRHALRDAPAVPEPNARCIAYIEGANGLRTAGANEAAVEALEGAWALESQITEPSVRYRLFVSRGQLLGLTGRLAEARPLLERAVVLAEASGDREKMMDALSVHAHLLFLLGDMEEAAALFHRVLALLSPATEPRQFAIISSSLGNVLRAMGERPAAYSRFIQALDVLRSETESCPEVHCLVEARLTEETFQNGDLHAAWSHACRARDALLDSIRANPLMEGIAAEIGRFAGLFPLALHAGEGLLTASASICERERLLWEMLGLLDSIKCVAIREGLRRHAGSCKHNLMRKAEWQAGPPNWEQLFEQVPQAAPSVSRSRVRGAPRGVASASHRRPIRELPGEGVSERDRYTAPATVNGLKRLLGSRDTLLLKFYFDGDDLLVIPVRLDEAGAPHVITREGAIFRVPRCRPLLLMLVRQQVEVIQSIQDKSEFVEPGTPPLQAHSLTALSFNLTSIYSRAFITLDGPRLLDWLRGNVRPLESLHLVIVPDGPLFELPLHAMPLERPARQRTQRLYEHFRSVRYGLSLRTLELQAAQDEGGQDSLRGVLVANARDAAGGLLEGVHEEARRLIEATGPASWWVHGERAHMNCQATRANLLARHGSGNLLWLMGHGGSFKDEVDGLPIEEQALYLRDGAVGISRLLAEPYDFSRIRLLVLNACWLGKIDPASGFSKEIEGYNAVLALRGCRRITSALWPVDDGGAPHFASVYLGALLRRVFRSTLPEPSGFALALKDAVSGFRHLEHGAYDHEYFWAPFLMYGLG